MGCYVISVSAGTGCYRHIQISKDASLYMLHKAIINAFDFDDDHEHAFFMDNHYWSRSEAYFSTQLRPGEPVTKSRKLSKLGLEKGKRFKYLFDFGDEWWFQCKVLRENDEHTDIPFVVRRVGDSPEQYPEENYFTYGFDERWDDEEEIDEETERMVLQVFKKMRDSVGLPEDTVETVRKYFRAAANLYGIVPLVELWRIYNSQNEPITADQILTLAAIFDIEEPFLTVIGPEDFDDEAEEDPSKLLVVASYLLEEDDDDFLELLKGQQGKPYKIFPKAEFLKYEDECYFPETFHSLAMRDYLRRHGGLKWPDDALNGIQIQCAMDYTVTDVLRNLSMEGFVARDLEDMREFIDLFHNLSNHTYKRVNCGHTPAELYDPKKCRPVIAGSKMTNKPKTPSLNSPCPCGSGKKYKRCCGKEKKGNKYQNSRAVSIARLFFEKRCTSGAVCAMMEGKKEKRCYYETILSNRLLRRGGFGETDRDPYVYLPACSRFGCVFIQCGMAGSFGSDP